MPKKSATALDADSREHREKSRRAFTDAMLTPEVTAGRAILAIERKSIEPYTDIGLLQEALTKQSAALKAGDSQVVEGVLMNQITVLDHLFARLVDKALQQDFLPNVEVLMRLALKAQVQSRTTAQTLSEIRNPSATVFTKQANIAHGLQQVNNGAGKTGEASHKQRKCHNKILEQHDGQRLDTRAPSAAGRADSSVAPVEKGDRAENR